MITDIDKAAVDELVEWFEDVVTTTGTPYVVSVVGPDEAVRRATMASLYERIAEHPRFAGAWSARLDAGSMQARLDPNVLPATPRFCWLGITASELPLVESTQLLEQLEHVGRFGEVVDWLSRAGFDDFRAGLCPPSLESAGEVADLAFAPLGDPVGQRAASVASAVRMLDDVVNDSHLLADGGALGLDGPRPGARALLAAGWLQRIAETYPLVVAVDDAHRAGRFLTELVRATSRGSHPILVVLAGRANATDADMLEGAVGKMATTTLQLAATTRTALPALDHDAAAVAHALTSSIDDVTFTNAQLAQASAHALIDRRPDAVLDTLVESGWVRRLTADVSMLSSATHRLHALGGVSVSESVSESESVSSPVVAIDNDIDERRGVGVDLASADPADVTALVTASTNVATRSCEETWQFALGLARAGEIEHALSLVTSFAVSPRQQAIVMSWWATRGMESRVDGAEQPALGTVAPADVPASTESLVIRATTMATRHRGVALTLARRAIGALGEMHVESEPEEMRLRIAAARAALVLGDLRAIDEALGPAGDRWLSLQASTRLAHLEQWRDQPGLVRRALDVLSGLELIGTLRATVPGSAALGHSLLARLALLERLGRLDTVYDTEVIADEAVTILAPGTREPSAAGWHARCWRAFCRARRGDHADALAELDDVIAEQQRAVPSSHPLLSSTRLWTGRVLLLAGRAADAEAELSAVIAARAATAQAGNDDLLLARLHRSESLLALGRYDEALNEADAVLIGAGDCPDREELVLQARHRRGSALANLGHGDDALAELDDVIARRRDLDLEDAPRLVAARHSHAVALLHLEQPADALAELNDVLAQRTEALPAADPLLVETRNDRAVCLLLVARWHGALEDLDAVVAARADTSAPDDAGLVVARQQRAVCLAELGRSADAAAEIDAIVEATRERWPADHPLLVAIGLLRDRLVPPPVPLAPPVAMAPPVALKAHVSLAPPPPAVLTEGRSRDAAAVLEHALTEHALVEHALVELGAPDPMSPWLVSSAAGGAGEALPSRFVSVRSAARRTARARTPWFWLAATAPAGLAAQTGSSAPASWASPASSGGPWAPPAPLPPPPLPPPAPTTSPVAESNPISQSHP